MLQGQGCNKTIGPGDQEVTCGPQEDKVNGVDGVGELSKMKDADTKEEVQKSGSDKRGEVRVRMARRGEVGVKEGFLWKSV